MHLLWKHDRRSEGREIELGLENRRYLDMIPCQTHRHMGGLLESQGLGNPAQDCDLALSAHPKALLENGLAFVGAGLVIRFDYGNVHLPHHG